jgi:small-conductance mechanosensitive channel
MGGAVNPIKYLSGVPAAFLRYLESDAGKRLVLALAVAAILLIALRIVKWLMALAWRRRGTLQAPILADKALQYAGFAAIALLFLNIAGLDSSAFLGAAGIAGIALGFAAQTSISNVISGLFLITEKAFSVGDVIRAGETTGTVKSIDVLSVKLVTFDNQLVRIPNETLIKSVIVNITRHPVRRLNVRLLVPHETDLLLLREALAEIAAAIPQIMIEPEPFFFADSWDQEGVWVLYGLWIEHSDIVTVKNEFFFRVAGALSRRGIGFPKRAFAVEDAARDKKGAPGKP